VGAQVTRKFNNPVVGPTPISGKLLQPHAGVLNTLTAVRNDLLCQPPLNITTAGSGHAVVTHMMSDHL
jgi:hypothetical protein